jgi:hypothetical protein
MHTASETPNFNRGYEWWLMSEAKKRNPVRTVCCAVVVLCGAPAADATVLLRRTSRSMACPGRSLA